MIKYVRLVNSRFASNTYILYQEGINEVWLVDPGDVQPVIEWIESNGKYSVSGVLLSHSHFDHIYGLNDIIDSFPDVRIYVANDYGKDLLFDAKKNGSRYTEEGAFIIKDSADVRFYESLDKILKDESVEAILTLGHSEDSVCLLIDNFLFTGDTVIKDTRTVTKLKGGSAESLKASLDKLEQLKGRGLEVCPGHGETFFLDNYDLDVCWINRLYEKI